MKPPLSQRLLACCSFVSPGAHIIDIGCDHGYLGIHLLQQGIANSVIAADINEGPLMSARQNAERFGVTDKISFHLSNGFENVPRTFDTVVCAGMGGDTIISILTAAHWLCDPKYHLILQCQSRRPALRRYLSDHGFRIVRETLAQDGHFIYPVMEVIWQPEEILTPGQCHISPALLRSGSPLLPAFFQMVMQGIHSTTEGLSHSGGPKYELYCEVLEELSKLEGIIHGNS